MHPEQKIRWTKYIKGTIAEKQKDIRQKEEDYTKTESAMTSRHDHLREDLSGELNTQNRILAQQKEFLKEIEGADLRYCVESGAWLDLFINNEPEQFLFMNTRGELPDVDIITPQSPMGQAIKGKIPGDTASFKVGSREFTVQIKSIL